MKNMVEHSNIRINSDEANVKKNALQYIDSIYGVRSACFEKAFGNNRFDILVATKNQQVIICEIKTKNDIIKESQLINYLEVNKIVILFLERSEKLLKQIKKVPSECGIIILDENGDYEVIQRPNINQKYYDDDNVHLLGSMNSFRTRMKNRISFDKAYWYSIIIFCKFFQYKSNPDIAIPINNKTYKIYYENTLAMKRYINKFTKKVDKYYKGK